MSENNSTPSDGCREHRHRFKGAKRGLECGLADRIFILIFLLQLP